MRVALFYGVEKLPFCSYQTFAHINGLVCTIICWECKHFKFEKFSHLDRIIYCQNKYHSPFDFLFKKLLTRSTGIIFTYGGEGGGGVYMHERGKEKGENGEALLFKDRKLY